MAMITARTWCSRSRNHRVTPRNSTPASGGAQHAEQRDEHRGRHDEGDKRQRMPAQVGFGGLLGRLDFADGLRAGPREDFAHAGDTTMTAIAVKPRIRGKKPGPIRPAAVRHSIPIAISV